MATALWEKVFGQLRKRYGWEMIELLQHGDDCAASAALFREITSLKQNEAGLLMRYLSMKFQLMQVATEPGARRASDR